MFRHGGERTSQIALLIDGLRLQVSIHVRCYSIDLALLRMVLVQNRCSLPLDTKMGQVNVWFAIEMTSVMYFRVSVLVCVNGVLLAIRHAMSPTNVLTAS